MMRNVYVIYFWLFLLISMNSLAQTPVVSMAAMNLGYYGVENRVDVAVSECKCSDLIVATNNGTIQGKDCHYKLKPDHVGEAKILVKVKHKNKMDSLGSFVVKIYPVPDPVVTSNAFYLRDTIRNKELLMQFPELFCKIPGFRMEYNFRIMHYRITIYRNGSAYYSETIDNSAFSDSLKLKFNELVNNDVLLFDEIVVQSAEGKRKLEPVKKLYYSR